MDALVAFAKGPNDRIRDYISNFAVINNSDRLGRSEALGFICCHLVSFPPFGKTDQNIAVGFSIDFLGNF